jgi:hypothetical protein
MKAIQILLYLLMSKFSKSKAVLLKQKLQIILIIRHNNAKPEKVLG